MNPLSSFLRQAAIYLVVFITISIPFSCEEKTSTGKLDPGQFADPSREYNVHTWWHWMDGAITKEGITRDLESMHEQGISQATILNIGLFDGKDFGVPQVKFDTDEWYEMFRRALEEANRLGIAIGAHNCDGWSTSGGPWITPEMSMKQYTWTKTLVEGGADAPILLKQPEAVQDFYRDVAVVAYPDIKYTNSFHSASPEFLFNGSEAADLLCDGNPVSGIVISPGDRVNINFAGEFTADKLVIHPRKVFMWGDMRQYKNGFTLLASDEGQTYREIADITTTGANSSFTFDIPLTTSRHFRIGLNDESPPDPYYNLLIGELELLQKDESPLYSPEIPFHMEKTVSVKAAEYEHFNEMAESGQREGFIAMDDIIDLTGLLEEDGSLSWDAPEGSWVVVRFGYTITGKTNAPATAEGVGLECDKMDKAAVDLHFDGYAGKLADHAGEYLGNTFKFLLIDSWECQYQNWTDEFAEAFIEQRGYSLIPWIPVLCGETIGSTDLSEAFLYDFRKTIAELIDENYYGHFRELCHAYNLEMHAEVIYGGTGYPPLDILKTNSYVDLPMKEFWAGTHPETVYPQYDPVEFVFPDLPAHACSGYDLPVLGAEAYTGFAHYSESPVNLKSFGDQAFCRGINQMILHSCVHQPHEKKPGLTLGGFAAHFNRHNPWWNQASGWMEYHARLQYVLQQGSVVSDVLFYLGDQLPQSPFNSIYNDWPYGYRAAACNFDLLNQTIVKDGKIILPGKQEYSLLVMPDVPFMDPVTLQRIAGLVEQGASLYGSRPEKMLSLESVQNDQETYMALVDELWGDIDGEEIKKNEYGKGKVFHGMPVEEVLDELDVKPQFTTDKADPLELMYIHKRVADEDVFFVFNQQNNSLTRECIFRSEGNQPEIWNPVNGSISKPADYKLDNGLVRMQVSFGPWESKLFVIRMGSGSETDQPVMKSEPQPDETREIFEIAEFTGHIAFDPFYEASIPEKEISDLKPLTESEEKEIRYFAGTATYSIDFSIPEDFIEPGYILQLDIGNLESVAEISLNGQPLGNAWLPGMCFDVTDILTVENQLEAELTTTFRNRIIGDFREYGELNYAWTSSPLHHYLSAETELKPTGLMGPLSIVKSQLPDAK